MIDEKVVVFARTFTRSLHKKFLISALENKGGLVCQLLLRELGRITSISFFGGLVWL